MGKIKDLAVKAGSYTSNDVEKVRWVTIGSLWENDKGQYLRLNRHFNPAGIPANEGDDTILVSMFDPKSKGAAEESW